MVKVEAPSDLNEGYQFSAVVDGQTIPVTVPAGGVKQGQIFDVPAAPAPPVAKAHTQSITTEHTDGSQTIEIKVTNPDGSTTVTKQVLPPGTSARRMAPMHHWRHGLCSWCEVCCYSVWWMSWCCYPIVLGQVMQRLGLGWLGCQTKDASKTCRIVTILFVVLSLVVFVLNLVFLDEVRTGPDGEPRRPRGIGYIFYNLTSLVFLVFLVAHTLTRHTVRRRYQIPPDCCGDFGDFCCAWFCTCCSILQIARHTHDEHLYPYDCGSETGLAQDAPPIVTIV